MTDPIENFIYKIADYLVPIAYSTGHTPNIITTYALLLRLLALIYIYYNNYLLFVIFWIVGQVMDCLDGQLARKYNMTSNLGSIYDHISDFICNITLVVIVFSKLNNLHLRIAFFCFVIIIFSLSSVYNACLREQRGDNDKFSRFLRLCWFDPGLFGCGFANLMIIILTITILVINK